MEKKIIKRRIVKRKRGLPYRKWSDYETTLLVDYLRENEFEKPSGRVFYQKFVDTFHMKIEWTLVKNKMRNLRALFQKAQDWKRSDAVHKIPEGETVQSIVDRICPLFYSLEEIFGDKIKKNRSKPEKATSPKNYSSTLEIEDSEDTIFKSSFSPPPTPEPRLGCITVKDNIMQNPSMNELANSRHQSTPPPVQRELTTTAVENIRTRNMPMSNQNQTHDACTCLMELVKMMSSNQKEKMEYRKAHLQLEQTKFEFEKEKTFRELELKQREIEKNERLQILEIESKERVTLKELEYKYKRL